MPGLVLPLKYIELKVLGGVTYSDTPTYNGITLIARGGGGQCDLFQLFGPCGPQRAILKLLQLLVITLMQHGRGSDVIVVFGQQNDQDLFSFLLSLLNFVNSRQDHNGVFQFVANSRWDFENDMEFPQPIQVPVDDDWPNESDDDLTADPDYLPE